MSQKDCTSLHGSLQHVSFIYHDAWNALPSLSAFLSKFPNEYVLHHVPHMVMNDLMLWLTCLTCLTMSHSLLPRQCLDPNVHVYASLVFGLGFTFNNDYAGWHLSDGWAAGGHDIGWAECVALELAIYWLIQEGFRNADVTVCSDNMGVIAAFSNSKSYNAAHNDCICRITSALVPVCLTISLKYMPSCENLADPVSCGHTAGYSACLVCTFLLPTLCPCG